MPIFMLIFATVFGLLNYYTWRRFVRRLALPLWVRQAFGWLLFAIFVSASGYIPLRHIGWLDDRLMEIFALSVGAGFVFFALAVVYDLVRLVTDRADLVHRRFARFNLALDVAVIAIGVIYLLWGLYGAMQPPRIVLTQVETGRLTQPLKIVHLTDLHLGNGRHLDAEFAAGVVAVVNALNPDLVAITGDLTDASLEKVTGALAPLAHLKSRFGTFYVAGNHEYFYDLEATLGHLEGLGITVLRNKSVRLEGDYGRLEIVGLYDRVGERMGRHEPDAQAAMDQVDPDAAIVVLSHQPKLAERFASGSFDLMLSGHTHGGQIFPFGLLVRLDQPYLHGLYRHDDRAQVYVSAGTGYWGPPLRVLAPSEIAVITLQ